MDWDLWIGPAPCRPYHSAYHPANWRPWWDFGTGTVGDMGCHTLHIFFRELQFGAPSLVYGYGSTRHEGFFQPVSTPECQSRANMVTWEFPARGNLPPLSVHWYDGGMKPHRPVELEHGLGMPHSGLLFVGDKGKLMATYGGGNPFRRGGAPRGPSGGLLLPEEKFRDVQDPPKTLRRVEDHYGEWTRACKHGVPTICPIEFACETDRDGPARDPCLADGAPARMGRAKDAGRKQRSGERLRRSALSKRVDFVTGGPGDRASRAAPQTTTAGVQYGL